VTSEQIAPIAVVIPALDEEDAIGSLLREIDRTLVRDVIVGDNGSRDATPTIARELGAVVVSVGERGYGAACAGALTALAPDIRTIVFMDADGSDDPAEIPMLLDALHDSDLVIGSRQFADPGALTPPQRFGNWIAVRLIHLLYRHRYTDLGPFRAIRRDVLDRMGMCDRRYGWTAEMQVRALQIGARVSEVPVRYRKRVGRSKISGTVTGVISAGWWIVYTIIRRRFSK